jgi:hypothetical protein
LSKKTITELEEEKGETTIEKLTAQFKGWTRPRQKRNHKKGKMERAAREMDREH